MGRYYNGDIEGKFWFAVQSSDDADFFGSAGEHPDYLDYFFNKKDHLENIKSGISTCLIELGDWKGKLDKFFKDNNGYNDEMIEKQIGLKTENVKEVLKWYARLELGEQILNYVEKNDDCHFTAEL